MTHAPTRPKRQISKGDFYRACREWHGYLSAFAFFALILFSATGILLNHPGLLQNASPEPFEATLSLTGSELVAVESAAAPAQALAAIMDSRAQLIGSFRSGEVIGDDIYVNMQGVRGRTDITGNLQTGAVTIYVERENIVGILNGLHRAEHAGYTWRLLVDLIAISFIAMALVGFALFLSLRFRVRSALAIMASSLMLMIAAFVIAVS